MRIAKRDIVEMLMARGDLQRAIRADEELPEVVYAERHARLLWDLGLDPVELSRDIVAPGRQFSRPGTSAGRRSLAGRS
jgi:hypothetical protein